MFRWLASSFLSLLLLSTVLWGGCVSCEQYFTFGKSHGCCNPDGRCKTKAPTKNNSGRECKQIAFDHHKGINLHFGLPVVAIATISVPAADEDTFWHRYTAVPFDPSPPDFQILHSVFLI